MRAVNLLPVEVTKTKRRQVSPREVGRVEHRVQVGVGEQLFVGVQVTKEEKQLVVRLEKPAGFGAPPEKDLIASSGFNDARGMNSNPVPGSPFPLDIPNRVGGAGEPGWMGPWRGSMTASPASWNRRLTTWSARSSRPTTPIVGVG